MTQSPVKKTWLLAASAETLSILHGTRPSASTIVPQSVIV